MADEQNLNGLAAGSSGSGAQNAVKMTARTLVNDYWNKAQAAAASIRRDMEAAERSARAIGGSMGKVNLSPFDVPSSAGGTGGGLGGGRSIMARPTFSVDSSGAATRLSQSTAIMPANGGSSTAIAMRQPGGSVMPFGSPQAMGAGYAIGGGSEQRAIGSAGYYSSNIMPWAEAGALARFGGRGGGIVPFGGSGGGAGGGGAGGGGGNGNRIAGAGLMAAGALAAYGQSKQASVYGRDFVAQQMASMTGGNAKNFYGGQYATIMGQSSTSDMLQARGTLNSMGYLPGTAEYSALQSQISKVAMQTGLGAAGGANVVQNLRSANVNNRGRAMLGISAMGANGQPTDVNTYARQIMMKLYNGKGMPTSAEVASATKPGGAIDYALSQLGMDSDTQNTIEASMKAQATGGGGISSLNLGRAATSKAKSVAAGSNIEATAENGAVVASENFNKAADSFKSGVDSFLKATGTGDLLGGTSSTLGHLGHLGADVLGFKGLQMLLKKGGGAVGEAESAGSGAIGWAKGLLGGGGAAAAGEGALKFGARRFMPIGVGGVQHGPATWVGLGGTLHTGTPSANDSGTYYAYGDDNMKHGMKFSPSNPLTSNPAFTGSDGAGSSGGSGAPATKSSNVSQNAVSIAMKYLGTPYVWGGNEPGGFDCSGLVQTVYRQLGVNLPRSSKEQARCGTAVGGLAAAKPGDLLFWGSPVHHVAIYIGNGKMIAAPHAGTNVQVQNVYGGIVAIRRVLGNSNSVEGNNTNTLAVGMGASGSGGSTSSGSGSNIGSASVAALLGGSALSTSATGVSGNAYSAASTIAAGLAGGGGSGGIGGGGLGGGGSTGIGSGSNIMSGGGGGPTVSAPANVKGNAALAQRLAKAYGWNSGAEWDALYATWQEESGFNNNNQNPHSTAYGIAQFLDSTWGDTGYKKTSDPATQINAGLKYIKNRYGDPVKEWAFHKQHNYYAQGAYEIAQDQDARVHAGEMVVTKEKADKVRAANRAGGGGGGGSVSIVINTMTIDDAAVAKVVAAVKKANQVDSITAALMMGS